MSSSHSAPPSLRPQRAVTFTGLVAITFLCVAGGAFGLEDAVGASNPFVVMTGILLLPWLWSFPTALMTAELSTAMPEDGGYVLWVQKAFGRFWGFQEGWLSWLCSFADNALYPVMFVDYLAYLRGEMPPLERWLIGTSVIAAITWLNIRGIRLVALTSVVFTLFVLAPFAALVIVGAHSVEPSVWLARSGDINWALLMSTLLWNTSGWDNSGCCAGEVKNPERIYPRAMALTVLLVTLAYLLPIAVGVSADTNGSEWKEGYFPVVAARIGGAWLGTWLTLAGIVSAAAMLSALLCTSARVPYAMADRGMLPRPFAALHARYATPWVAIIINSLGLAMLIPFSFQELIEVDMCLYALALILEFAAFIWLRVKQPEMPRPYRIPYGTPGAILISVPPIVLCLTSIGVSNIATKYVSLAGIAAGVLVYWAQCRMRATRETEPAPTA